MARNKENTLIFLNYDTHLIIKDWILSFSQ
jgi:hypothetical protein